ncbi:hypothetical protein JB92DRAFT_2965796 [Gautieria morchelliformis]|nr:hypothetical protein JB92DRAFT_2965796 [Gautieria morchelliformis]
MVQGFLREYWLAKAALILRRFVQVKGIGKNFRFAGADTTQHQRPDIRGQLIPVGVDATPFKSEGIVRKNWEAIVNRGREQVRLNWDGRGGWDVVDKILLKVTTYMVSYNMKWLCWTAASHLIVFRIVQHPPQNPYLVISDVVQVDDTRKPDPDPVDRRIGERWMTCVVGCSLAGLAAPSRGQFHFDVEDLSSTSGDPKVTPAEEDDLNALSDTAGETSSGSNWTPQSGRQSGRYIDAFLVFSKGEVPCALAAPLVGSPLLTETEQCDQEGLPYRYRKTMDILCSTVPRLNVNGFLGRGSTGTVFSGSWQGKDVAVKLAESEESRDRLRLESLWYGKIAEREQAKDILPTFFGRFRHSIFDVLVLSKEGNALTSWNDLVEDERLELFSMALKLHQAGLRHGDLEPRNVLRSTTGQLKLVDLSEASEHQCCGTVQRGSRKRRRLYRCSELIRLRRELDLDNPKEGASHATHANDTGQTLSGVARVRFDAAPEHRKIQNYKGETRSLQRVNRNA